MMKIDESTWTFIQRHLGYTDEEMVRFRENPVNEDILTNVMGLLNKTVVAEVVESHGCASQHQVGDKFYFDGAGNLLTGRSPEKVCTFALHAFSPCIFAGLELFMAGVNPNQMRFKRAGCQDVGIRCGGWGNIVMEYHMEENEKS
jgi:uncharacterized repeat protein (TIGR04076 family)